MVVFLTILIATTVVFSQTRRRRASRPRGPIGHLSHDLEKVLYDSLSRQHQKFSGYLFQADADSAAESLLLHLVGAEASFRIVVRAYAEYNARLSTAALLEGFGGTPDITLHGKLKEQTQGTLIAALNKKYSAQPPAIRVHRLSGDYPVKNYKAAAE